MRLAYRMAVASILSVLTVGLVPQAHAGGTLANVEPRSWARQGSEIRLNGTFCDGSQAPVSAGPWFAYLDPQTAPPILVGRVRVSPNTGNYCQWRLNATLRVPYVAPGSYWLQVCDRGCTQGVGDLIGAGEFTVVGAGSLRKQALQLQELRSRLRESRREERRQEQMLAELDDERAAALARSAKLERHADRLSDQLATERSERSAWFGVILTSGVVAAVIAFLAIRRRRRTAVIVPDTPAELLERSNADF
jgi:hypothetical protein